MPSRRSVELRDLFMTADEAMRRNTAALRTHTAVFNLLASYEDLLKRRIFSAPSVALDEKALRKHKRVLTYQDSYSALLVIWRESDFVSDEQLEGAGLQRRFNGAPLTAHSLAISSAESAADLSKVNSRLQNIVQAAEVFGLIQRANLRRTNRPLIATKRLNDFLVELAEINCALVSDIQAQPLTRLPQDVPQQ